MGWTRAKILKNLKDENVTFLRMQFTDILGHNKNIEVPTSQFEKALDGELMFDGSSVEGFTRIEESDMLLKPDYDTYLVMPDLVEGAGRGKVARLICDIANPDDTPFEGDPRYALRRQIERLKKLGFDDLSAGPEPEFFVFEADETVYVAGDTIWYEPVEETLDQYEPNLVVLNGGEAQFDQGESITMGVEDVDAVREATDAEIVVVHMEAINHCLLSREELRAETEDVHVPEDGERFSL